MDSEPPSLINKLTIPGRLLLIVTIMIFAGGVYFFFFQIIDSLLSGEYPWYMFCLPAALFCFFFFLCAGWLLERCGVKIYKRS